MLRLDGVCKTFFDPGRGPVRAVDDLHLDCGEGVVALVGANGAGKTTLLRLLATLLQADAGRLIFDGLEAGLDGEAWRRRTGFLSAGSRLYARLTAREQLAYAGGFYGLEPQELTRRINELAVRFGFEAILDQRGSGLSTGQGQRVALARTLIGDPDLLILDEPTTGLDLVAAHRVVATVQTERRPGRLVLIATHVMAEVEALADRLLVLDRGRLVFDGPPAGLGSGPALAEAVQRMIQAEVV